MAPSDLHRAWQDLTWPRLVAAAVIAPLPALYIGFSAFVAAYSDRNLASVFRVLFPEPQIFVWGWGIVFTLLYLNLVSRFRGRVGMFESIVAGGAAVFLLAEAFFMASLKFRLIGPLPYMTFFPGFVLWAKEDQWALWGGLLGLILVPAGALSGWIFWRIGVAPAVARGQPEIF